MSRMLTVKYRSELRPVVGAEPVRGRAFSDRKESWNAQVAGPGQQGRKLGRTGGEEAFSLIELLIVVAIIGILSAIALPQLMVARQAALEKAIVSNLKVMASNQQIFYLSPVPLAPSSKADLSKRFARLHELNSYSKNIFGRTIGSLYVDGSQVTYSMVPLWPSTTSLRGRFLIQAAQQSVVNGFLYQVDESGRVVKIR